MFLLSLDSSQMMLIGILDLRNLFRITFTVNFLCYSQRWKAIFIIYQIYPFRTLRGHPHFQDLRSWGPTNYILHVLIFFLFWMHHAACGILVPWLGIEPGPSSESTESWPLDRQGIPILHVLMLVLWILCFLGKKDFLKTYSMPYSVKLDDKMVSYTCLFILLSQSYVSSNHKSTFFL